jgi:hypothetical protein
MQRCSDAGSVLVRPMARDRGCPRMLHRPIRAAGALCNGGCGKLFRHQTPRQHLDTKPMQLLGHDIGIRAAILVAAEVGD